MFIAIIIILFFWIIYATRPKPKGGNQKPVKNNPFLKTATINEPYRRDPPVQRPKAIVTIERTPIYNTPPYTPAIPDESIIDIDTRVHQIDYEQTVTLKKYHSGIPNWPMTYIYSARELSNANKQQKEFYNLFKEAFLRQELWDIQDQTNYAFILYYDLLNAFEKHQQLSLLERQLNDLASMCPKTLNYSRSFIRNIMTAKEDYAGLMRTQSWGHGYDEYYDWRKKYREALKLNKNEEKFLNYIWLNTNKFSGVEFCCMEILKLYIKVTTSLEVYCGQQGTSLNAEMVILCDLLARKLFRYHLNSPNYKSTMQTGSNMLFELVYKHCEQAVRDRYHHKRKVTLDTYANAELMAAVTEKLLNPVTMLIAKNLETIAQPDEPTEIELNIQNTNRWRELFQLDIAYYRASGSAVFEQELTELIRLNAKNPSLEGLYLEASKFYAAVDKGTSLRYFAEYFRQCMLQTKVYKPMGKAMEKQLFAGPAEVQRFDALLNEYIRTKDFEGIADKIAGFYTPVRKSITINRDAVAEAEKQFTGTVMILNEYLAEEGEPGAVSAEPERPAAIAVPAIDCTSVIAMLQPAPTAPGNPSFQGVISPVAAVLLELFEMSSFQLSADEVDDFCRNEGLFKNTLINGLNEDFYDILDDLLIETDEENYTINPAYFQQIKQL
jgi:hypothetical protein